MNDPRNSGDNQSVLGRTAEIAAAYAANNAVSPADLLKLIASTHATLILLQKGEGAEPDVELVPAVAIKKSVTPEFVICLEDGKKFKSLKRHLATHYGLTPEQYRQKWNLPRDYPMTAPSYSATRSTLAKANGLGRKVEEPPLTPARAKAPRRN